MGASISCGKESKSVVKTLKRCLGVTESFVAVRWQNAVGVFAVTRAMPGPFDTPSPQLIPILVLRVACAAIDDTLHLMVHQGCDTFKILSQSRKMLVMLVSCPCKEGGPPSASSFQLIRATFRGKTEVTPSVPSRFPGQKTKSPVDLVLCVWRFPVWANETFNSPGNNRFQNALAVCSRNDSILTAPLPKEFATK